MKWACRSCGNEYLVARLEKGICTTCRDSESDALIASASSLTLAALYKAGKGLGLITPVQAYR